MRADDEFALTGDPNAVRTCRVCGCTEAHACPGGCYWIDADLCSACDGDLGVRDPSQNPQPGDILAVGTDIREVLDRVGDRVEYGFPRRAASRWLPLIRWQVWARNAEVRKVAS